MNELVKNESAQIATTQQPMHPLVSMAMSSGTEMTPENLGKLLDVQRDWEADQARKAYSAAMVKFRSICPNIGKDANVNYKSSKGITNYDHETLNGIMKTITPALSECGINPTYRTGVEGATIIVTCRITHELGHYEETSLPAAADTSGGKNAIQGIGSTVTYLQRYTLKAMLGLSAGHDDDATPEPVLLINSEQALELDVLLDGSEEEFKGFKVGFLNHWSIDDVSEIHENNFDRARTQIQSTFQKRKDKEAEKNGD